MEGYMGFPLSAAYSATKGFVHFLGEALWQELKPRNVDVLILAPGSTDTEALSKQGFDKNQMLILGKWLPLSVVKRPLAYPLNWMT